MSWKPIYSLCIALLFANQGLLAEEIILKNIDSKIQIGKNIELYEDKTGLISFKEIYSEKPDFHFQKSASDSPGFGYVKSNVWAKFSVKNESDFDTWYLEHSYAPMDDIKVFIVKNRNIDEFQSGRIYPFSNKQIKQKNNVFRLQMQKGESIKIFMRLQTISSMLIPLAIWKSESFTENLNQESALWGFYYGMCIIMCLYHLFLFVSIKDITYLYYSAFIIGAAGFTASVMGQGHEFIWGNFPKFSRYSILVFWFFAVASFSIFSTKFLELHRLTPILNKIILGFFSLWTFFLFTIFLFPDIRLISRLLPIFAIVSFPFIIVAGIRSLQKGFKPARLYLLAFASFLLGGLIYAAKSIGWLPHNIFTNYIMQIGNIGDFLILSFALAGKWNLMKDEKEHAQKEAAAHKEALANSYARFIPQEKFSLIGKKSVTEVSLGDASEAEITVLFSDIRSFTTLSETMSPTENFEFLNALMKRTGPVIRENNGFIDKYIGDAIMAIFPDSPEDAIHAGIQMKQNLFLYNARRKVKGLPELRIGIGINTGRVIVGTIGENERMDATVISDAVNLASRIEGLTKQFETTMLISEQTLFRLPDPSKFKYRMLDQVYVKGKKEPVAIFEIFDGDPPEIFSMKCIMQRSFEHGVQSFQNGEYSDAINIFKKILNVNNDDVQAKIYLDRSVKFSKQEKILVFNGFNH
ncbi:MAG: hypothetical protein L6Q54_10400 [Leptospiraceae bacterium]|nr:hypothetical protein [Leptospiraceae bacterium]MCK6381637.1 hypothetical protein [Leptospiraceae bacterium]